MQSKKSMQMLSQETIQEESNSLKVVCKKLILIFAVMTVKVVLVFLVIQMPLLQSGNHGTHHSRKWAWLKSTTAIKRETTKKPK